jgi:hypothetical protein
MFFFLNFKKILMQLLYLQLYLKVIIILFFYQSSNIKDKGQLSE